MIKTLFIDFGNVIAHFDHWRAVRQFARHATMAPTELYGVLYDSKLEDDFERGRLTTNEYIAEALHRTRINLDADRFRAFFIDIFSPNADVIDAIPKLAEEYRLVLASNTNDAHFTHYTMRFKDTFAHFAATPTSHQCGHRKPEAGFYGHCQQFAEAEPDECLFIDDVAANIAAGREHGWNVLHYQPGDMLMERLKTIMA